jgi:hypothetical protein
VCVWGGRAGAGEGERERESENEIACVSAFMVCVCVCVLVCIGVYVWSTPINGHTMCCMYVSVGVCMCVQRPSQGVCRSELVSFSLSRALSLYLGQRACVSLSLSLGRPLQWGLPR